MSPTIVSTKMIVTILLSAKDIPDGTEVRKPQGQQKYVLRRELNIHMPGHDPLKIFNEGIVFLQNDRCISGHPDTARFAMDMDREEAIAFLEMLEES
jgi:hypothetical protein